METFKSDADVDDASPPGDTVSNPTELIIQPANPRRTPVEELQGLARRIARKGPRVAVRFAYLEPEAGKFGVTWAEIVYIWLPRMTDAIEAAIVIEIVTESISWARKRLRWHSKAPRYIYIYGADGRVLREIRVKDRRADPEIIVPGLQTGSGRMMAPLRERACGTCAYALILLRRGLRSAATKVFRSPQIIISAIRTHLQARTKRCKLRLCEEECQAVDAHRKLRRLVIDKIRVSHETDRIKLKENVTYGRADDTVQFDTVFEDVDGHASALVHIHCARKGSRKWETRRYAEALAQFREKRVEYMRIANRGAMAVFVLVVPQKDSMGPQLSCSEFPSVPGFSLAGWVFSHEDLGYTETQDDGKTAPKGL